jgi:hypothetical protein
VRVLFLVLSISILASCSSINVEKTGASWDVDYNSLFRELKDLYVKVDKDEGVTVSLGSASTSDQLVEITGSLMQNVADTGTITIMGGGLVDTLGRPRQATNAEMAAQYALLEQLNR